MLHTGSFGDLCLKDLKGLIVPCIDDFLTHKFYLAVCLVLGISDMPKLHIVQNVQSPTPSPLHLTQKSHELPGIVKALTLFRQGEVIQRTT